jgi:glycosyltransferase involved in cell wall biosynthesis
MPTYLHNTLIDTLSKLGEFDEIVLVDDGSSFENLGLVKKIVETDQRVKLVALGTNFGLSAARNVGVKNAKNEIILILDADDYIDTEFLEISRNLIASGSADIVVPQVAMFENEMQRVSGKFSDYAVFQGSGPFAGIFENRLGSASLLLRKEIALVHPYNEAMTSFEDWDLLSRIGKKGFRIHVYERIGLYYRMRLNSMVRTNGMSQKDRNIEILRSGNNIPAYVLKNFQDSWEYKKVSTASEFKNRSILTFLASNRVFIISVLIRLSHIPVLGRISRVIYQKGRSYSRAKGLNRIPPKS